MSPQRIADLQDITNHGLGPDYIGLRELISTLIYISLYDIQPSQKHFLSGKYKTKTLSPDWVIARNWLYKRWKTTLDVELCCDFLGYSYEKLLDLAKQIEEGKIPVVYKRSRLE